MTTDRNILAAKGGFLTQTYRETGLIGCARKIAQAIHMQLPMMLLGRRTNRSVGAYFDLITDDARMFYGDSFHFGYFPDGDETFSAALNNHTDLVARMTDLDDSMHVLDIGCGIGAPAVRIARRFGCRITGVNISAEQVRQGSALIAREGLGQRIAIHHGNALALDLPEASFDALLCIEVAGDICVSETQKDRLVQEMFRMLKPGGRIGFSDLAFTGIPSRADEQAMRTILFHRGAELITDWPKHFERGGFEIVERRDIIAETMKTWECMLQIYASRAEEVEARYGRRIARMTMDHLRRIPDVLERFGSFPVLAIQKPG